MSQPSYVSKLREILGGDHVFTDEETLVCYSFDATRYRARPDVVVKPTDTEQVARVIKLAYEESIPVTPRGAGTGLSGGSIPARGGIVISAELMNHKPQIHKEDLYVIVEPGVVTEDLQKHLEAKGLFYPIDPASQAACTIGGNVAECASGPRGLKYGTTRNYVLGLEVVDPNGKVIRVGARTVKSVAGYDIARLLVGSEGTLGFITSVTLKVLPLPPARRLLAATFDDVTKAAEAASAIIENRLLPSVIEIMDRMTIEASQSYIGKRIDGVVLLLIEFDGSEAVCDEEASKCMGLLKEDFGGAVDDRVDPDRATLLWEARRSALPALTRVANGVVLEDVTVPRSRLAAMIEKIQVISRNYGIRVAVFGHAGDGNLHPTLLFERKNRDDLKRLEGAIAEMMRACLDLGGTISGEHGIGLDKMPFLKLELSKAGYEIMMNLKRSLDPRNIMNPGKMFYE